MAQNFSYMNNEYLDRELKMSPEEAARLARVKALTDKALTTQGNFFQAPDPANRFAPKPMNEGYSLRPSPQDVQAKMPVDWNRLFGDNRVLGMQVPEYSRLMGGIARGLDPNGVGGRLGNEMATLGNEQIAMRREDQRPENIQARMKLDALRQMMGPKVEDPAGSVLLNPNTPASQTRLSLMTPNSFLDGNGQPRSISTPAPLGPEAASTLMNHNTSPMIGSPQPLNIFQAEGIASGQSMAPIDRQQKEATLQNSQITNSYLPQTTEADIAYKQSGTAYNQMHTQLAIPTFEETVRGNRAREVLESRSINERIQANRTNEAQREQNQLDKVQATSSSIAGNHQKIVEQINTNTDKLLMDPRYARDTTRHKTIAAQKGIVQSSAAIRDGIKFQDRAAVMSGQSLLLGQIERGIEGINAAKGQDAEKIKTEGIKNILSGLEAIRDIDPDYYNQVVSELPGRINATMEYTSIPLWGKVGKGTKIWDATKAIEEYEASKGRGRR